MADCRDALVNNSTTGDCITMPEFDMHHMFVSLAVPAVATSICAGTWWTNNLTGFVHQVVLSPDGQHQSRYWSTRCQHKCMWQLQEQLTDHNVVRIKLLPLHVTL